MATTPLGDVGQHVVDAPPPARNTPAARPTLLSSGIGAMAAPHSSSTTASSTGPKSPLASGAASSVQPRSTTVFHSVRQRSGSVIAWRATLGRALGTQDVAYGVAQRQLLRIQSDIHKTPNIIKIVN